MISKLIRSPLFWALFISVPISVLYQWAAFSDAKNDLREAEARLQRTQDRLSKLLKAHELELELLQWRIQGQKKFLAERQFASETALHAGRSAGLFGKPTPVRLGVSRCTRRSMSSFAPVHPLVLQKAVPLLTRMKRTVLSGIDEWECGLGQGPATATLIAHPLQTLESAQTVACSLLYAPAPGQSPWHCVTPSAWLTLLTGGLTGKSLPFESQWEIIEICSVGIPPHPAFGDFRFVGCELSPAASS